MTESDCATPTPRAQKVHCGQPMQVSHRNATPYERKLMGWRIGDCAPKPFKIYKCTQCGYEERDKHDY